MVGQRLNASHFGALRNLAGGLANNATDEQRARLAMVAVKMCRLRFGRTPEESMAKRGQHIEWAFVVRFKWKLAFIVVCRLEKLK